MKYSQMTKLTHLKVYKRRFKKPAKGSTKGKALIASQEPPGLIGAHESSHMTHKTINSNRLTTATPCVRKTLGLATGGASNVSLASRSRAFVLLWAFWSVQVWGLVLGLGLPLVFLSCC